LFHIGGRTYALIHDHKNGWNPEAFRSRFSEVLERYDYVIGDWGYNQLRLKGFFRDDNPKVTRDTAFSGIVDYINEYCNFGCAYFVLEKLPGGKRIEDADVLDLDDMGAEERPYTLEPAGNAGQTASAEAEPSESSASFQPFTEQGRPRNHRDGRRDFGRRRDGGQGGQIGHKEIEREQAGAGRKPFPKDKDGGYREKDAARQRHQNGSAGSGNIEKADRFQSQASDRQQRSKKLPFNAPKAPVAAAAEHPAQAQRGSNDKSAPKGNR
jgi:uncharacterized protein YutD